MVKKYVCTPRSFLVINACNQGKTSCSSYIYIYIYIYIERERERERVESDDDG